jgi:ribosome hibernation promoting factor
MQMNFRLQNTALTEAVQRYVERRLLFALGRFGDRVGQVVVRISDIGGAEHQCRITIELRPFGRVAVRATDSDLFAAIDRATGRAGRLFGRELQRVREARTGNESVRIAAQEMTINAELLHSEQSAATGD